MLSLNDILIALGGVLVIIVALHAYAHWSIRNIDRNEETETSRLPDLRVSATRPRLHPHVGRLRRTARRQHEEHLVVLDRSPDKAARVVVRS
jgi:hypothetical protein